MVDNENQWEDTEYSEDENEEYMDYDEQSEYSNDEYGSEEYVDDGDEIDYGYDYDEPDETTSKKSGAPIILILVLLLLIGGVGYCIYDSFFGNKTIVSMFGGDKSKQNTEQVANNNQQSDMPSQNSDSSEMGDYFFNEAGGNEGEMMSVDFNAEGNPNVQPQNQEQNQEGNVGEQVDNIQVSQQEQQGLEIPNLPEQQPENNQEGEQQNVELPSETDMAVDGLLEQNIENMDSNQDNNSIMVSYAKPARENPFKPLVDIISGDNNYAMIGDTEYEILEPPIASTPDENLTKLLQTQISGILYDEESPSAIVNLNGIDQFVKEGDEVSGYTIDSITKDRVQISYKANSYVAAVGQLFTRGSLEKQPAVVNLENKFAGRYRNN